MAGRSFYAAARIAGLATGAAGFGPLNYRSPIGDETETVINYRDGGRLVIDERGQAHATSMPEVALEALRARGFRVLSRQRSPASAPSA